MNTLFRLSLCFVIAVLPVHSSGTSLGAENDTAAIQARLNAVRQQQMAAEKQITLKKATIDVANERVAQLQKQLKESQQRIAAAEKSLQSAVANKAAAEKQAATLAADLRRHQQADALVAKAAAVQQKVDAAKAKHQTLQDQLAALKISQAEQQQLESKAVADLKAATEQLPKTKEELTKARAALDAAGREVDIAKLAMEKRRQSVKALEAAIPPERSRRHKAQAALAQVNGSAKALQESLAALQAAAKTAGSDPVEAGAELAKSLDAVNALQKRAAELVATTDAKLAAAQKQLDAAKSEYTAAEAKLREHQDKYAEHSRSHFRLQLKVADLQSADGLQNKRIADAISQQKALAAQQAELEPQIASAAAAVKSLEEEFVNKQKLAETSLAKLGRFVSFSEHIAPIFAKRCVACHNTRTASGRLNMDSFAAIAKGGESGAAFEAHDAESSLLWAMVDDGSMPKDADPLTKEEIAIIKQWINSGAPLDAGVVATADLFQVMPEIAQPLPPETYRVPIPVTATAFNADASILASSGYHEILLWKTADGSLIRRITNVAERVYDLEFSADGSQLAVAAGTPGQLGEVKLFSTSDGAHQKTLVRTKDVIFAVSYSPDGKSVAAAGADRVVYVVNVESGNQLVQIEDHADWVMDVNWSPTGKQLVTASRDKTSRVFDVASGQSVITFNGHADAVFSAAFLTDGNSIVSAGSDRQARVWKVADAKEARKIGGFGSDIFRVEVTPDNHLLTASADRNAREHDLANGKVIRTFAGHKDWVYTLSYNAAKNLIATGSYDGEIRVWNSKDGSVATSFIAIPKAGDAATVAAAEE